jgi:RluA family pseudouridine synthase
VKKILPYTVLYEDATLIAVDKASGIAVGPDRWEPGRARLDALLSQALGGAQIYRVHRLDSGCSGVVVFAKDAATHQRLSLAFQERTVDKTYIAIVRGRVPWRETIADFALVPDGNKKHQTIVDRYRGKKALTRFQCLCAGRTASVVRAFPLTGRQHQIRVHLARLGYPIVGDALYGSPKPLLLSEVKPSYKGDRYEERPLVARLALHSTRLILPAPNALTLEAPIPRDMRAAINQLQKRGEVYEE